MKMAEQILPDICGLGLAGALLLVAVIVQPRWK